MSQSRYQRSDELLGRAERVIPGGIYGHQNPRFLTPGAFPCFLAEAEGCRVRDVDGNSFIDFMCGYGPIVLGYRHPRVEEAAQRQRRLCDTMNQPGEPLVELAERLVSITPGADWSLFGKNGSDVCTWALAIARAATGRELVAMVDDTYHGVHGWCNHVQTGFPDGDRSGIATFAWNDLGALEGIFADNPSRLAAVIITPFRHEALEDSQLPATGFLEGIRALCTKHGTAMIVDDVRAGFRLHIGGSTQCWRVTPDMICYSKALANGYPLSALLGGEALRTAAREVFVTGTFYTQSVPLAAALATVDELEACDAIGHMKRMGTRLGEGLLERASAAGFAVTISGPPSIPFMTFDQDGERFERSRVFAGTCAKGGVFLHPYHNWFISAAHDETTIDATLEVAEQAFAELRETKA